MSIEDVRAKSTDELKELQQWLIDRSAYRRKCGIRESGEDTHIHYMIEDELGVRGI